ncbi:Growth arrest-specific protein 7 [Labeo rohita]|uniref:Growth arrest-specific protein 7 n=1 Tax=Labeo rohita TaxID=84645 RepID=A0ABQ8M7D9_LABRO|nr:Growth arrest-specific protein 7 [Labeo rohita]
MSGSFCRSLYAYNGDQHQQGLKFEAGELIRITQALDGGWWEGEKDGVKGWFPSTYVQVEHQCTKVHHLTFSLPVFGDKTNVQML